MLEKEHIERETQEQVELCGDEFIHQLQKLVDSLVETPFATAAPFNNGNKTQSSLNQSELGAIAKQELDSTRP